MPRQAPRLSQIQKLQLNTQLASSIRILRYEASGLNAYLNEQAEENPYLVLTPAPPESVEWLPRWTTAFAAQSAGGAQDTDVGALIQSPALGLIAHITRQIDQITRSPRERDIALQLMEALEPSGWLGRPLARLAVEIGCSLTEAEAVLERLHGMEPTGLFARSLSECLRLQAEDSGVFDSTMAVIFDNLDLLADANFAQIAKLCGVPQAEVLRRLGIIRGFDPKPGTQFGQVSAPVREPDLIVTRGQTGWVVSLNRSALPDVTINPRPDGVDKNPNALKQARELQRVVANRNTTLLRAGQEILTRQDAVLSQGLEALKPMGMQEIAAAVGLHVSTISRAIAGVSVDTPRGTIWLRALFTAAVGGTQTAGGALRAHLQRLIRLEDPRAPLSDHALALALSGSAAPVARRTVAKYRTALNIPPAHRRKQRD